MNRHIRRLKRGAALATTVAIGLTPALVAAPSANAAAPVPVTRIAGANRFGTAAAIAEAAFPAGASTVIVATGFNFPDALAGNYLAGVDKAPILLVNVDNVPSETSAALQTLKAKNVIILGQTNAVDTNTENQLKTAGYTTSRIGGATRLETMQMIDEAPNATTIGTVNGKKTALLARADNFPDALGGGPVAYAKNFPVILTATDALSPQAQDVITKDGIQQVIILGGNLAVSAATETAANTAGAATLYRANGVDRSDTSRLLAEYALANLGFVNTSYGIASGDQNYTGADALASGPFSGGIPQPTLVTNSINDPGTLVQYGAAHNATATKCYAFGGPIPLPDSTVNAVCNAAPASNQTYSVSPSTASSANVSGGTTQNVTYTVSGLPAGVPLSIELFNCANVTTSNGNSTFNNSSNPGGSGNVAQPGTVAPATITQVNGAGVTPAAQQNNVSSSGGTLTFVVSSNAPGCVTPVVFSNADGDNLLNLGTNNQPTEPFGVGGSASFFKAAPAGTTAFPGNTVTAPSSSSYTDAATGNTYAYGPSDVYQLVVGGTCTASSYAVFQQRLSTGDQVSGTYNPPPAGPGSTFCLNDIAPVAPAGVTTGPGTGTNAGLAGIQVSFTDSTTTTVASYNVYRATATQPTITGGIVTCPTLTSAGSTASPQTPPASGSPYQKVGSVTDATPSTSGGETYTFFDSTATPPATGSTPPNPQYCYAVTSVDKSAQEGSPSAVAGPAQAGTATTAPKFASATASAGTNTVSVVYNQAIATGPTCTPAQVDANGSDFSVVYTIGGVSTAVTPVSASCTNPTTVAIVLPAGSIGAGANAGTVTVTAKNGTDGNTVGNQATPQQFQPVGDAVIANSVGA